MQVKSCADVCIHVASPTILGNPPPWETLAAISDWNVHQRSCGLQLMNTQATMLLRLCMQAVPVAQMHSYSQLYPQQAVFALSEPAGRLYTAGGAAPSTVHTWDMSQERCTQQVGSGSPFIQTFIKH